MKKEEATWVNYCWQLGIAGIFVFCVLLLFKDTTRADVLWALGVSSLASSAFIIFSMPNTEAAQNHRVLSSYFVNMAIGAITHYFLEYVLGHHGMFSSNGFYIFSFVTALAVSLSLVLMIVLKIKHPPAVGVCIILIINMHRYDVIGVIAFAALLLAVLHYILKRWMLNL